MDTQNTPIHFRLWHGDFWMLILSAMLAAMSVYMLVPVLPNWLMRQEGYTAAHAGLAMGLFGAGLFVLGPFCSHLVLRYRRNKVYIVSLIAMAASVVPFALAADIPLLTQPWTAIALRVITGACYGLAQMTLMSTLILDVTESFQRTEANYAAAWFSRFALSLGPLCSLVILQHLGFRNTFYASIACALLAVVFISVVKFHFKAPADIDHIFSLDRFFLPRASLLFVALMVVMIAVGMVLSLPLHIHFYAMLMVGFFLSIVAERMAFADADLKSQMITGLILMAGALLLMAFRSSMRSVPFVAPAMLGFGIGLIGSRFLLFFVKFSGHCQRGTSQSSFMLSWESGIAIGIGLGVGCFQGQQQLRLEIALAIVLVSLILYNFCIHPWYMKNKNR